MLRVLTVITCLLVWNLGISQAVDDRPNIMLIVADDLAFTDLGSFGGEISTPTLDELAFTGVRLNNLHAAPYCQPTRVMLLASAGATGATELLPNQPSGQRANRLSLAWATLPELLQDAGYQTYMAGKWDVGLSGDYTPAKRGFDRSFAMLEASASHFAEYFWTDAILYEEDGHAIGLDDLPPDFYSTRAYTEKMLEYLQSHDGDAPWFAYLPYTAPHWPLQVPDAWLDRYAGRYEEGFDALREERVARAEELGVIPAGASLDRFEPVAPPWESLTLNERREFARAQEIYAAMIEYLDESIGHIVDYLEDSEQLDDTVIFFMSDHGASSWGVTVDRFEITAGRDNRFENFGRINSFIDHGVGFAEAGTAPLKHYKTTVSEGGLRAAAFVRFPPSIPGGGVSDAMMSVMDVLPTFLEIAGAEHPGEGEYKGRQIHGIKGRSLWPYLIGDAAVVHAPSDGIGWIWGDGGALIKGDYKVVKQRTLPGSDPESWQLYNIAEDPGETRDLSAESPELTAELVQELESNWR